MVHVLHIYYDANLISCSFEYILFCTQKILRKELGMDDELPAVLLMGGGEGMGPVESTARALGEALYDKQSRKPIGQLVVICGKNKKLIKKLQSIEWSMPVHVSDDTLFQFLLVFQLCFLLYSVI